MKNIENIQKLLEQIKKEYQQAVPYAYQLTEELLDLSFDEDFLQQHANCSETELRSIFGYVMFTFAFPVNKKASLQKSLDTFLDNFVFDPQVYEYLMEHSPVVQQFDKSLTEGSRKKSARVRKSRKASYTLSAIRSFGLSNLFNKHSEKKLKEILNNEIISNCFTILTIVGVDL